jgi:cation transport ATPase
LAEVDTVVFDKTGTLTRRGCKVIAPTHTIDALIVGSHEPM